MEGDLVALVVAVVVALVLVGGGVAQVVYLRRQHTSRSTWRDANRLVGRTMQDGGAPIGGRMHDDASRLDAVSNDEDRRRAS